MKKKTLALLLTLCMVLSVLPFSAAAVDFTDVNDGMYYAEAVDWAVNHDPQITKGVGGTRFAPDETCTRDQVVTFLWRAMGEPKVEGKNLFGDVKKDDYFYEAVLWANASGVTTGKTSTTFAPNDPCTRGQVATFLWRAMEKPETSIANPFKDLKKDEYYVEPVLWAFESGVTNGTDATHFSPDATCTRGQIVTFLHRCFNPSYAYLMVKETTKFPNGDTSGFIWKYDDRGNNIRVEMLDGSYWEEFTFNDKGARISGKDSNGRTFTFNDDAGYAPVKTDCKYDDQGRLIEEIYHYEEGDDIVRYTYDAQGNLTKIVDQWPDGWKSEETITYASDGDWASSVSKVYDEKGEFQYETTYYYNEETGDVDKIVAKNADGSFTESTFRYEYDEEGFLKREIETTLEDDGHGNQFTTETTREYVPIPVVRLLNDWPMRFYPNMPEG